MALFYHLTYPVKMLTVPKQASSSGTAKHVTGQDGTPSYTCMLSLESIAGKIRVLLTLK